MNCNEYDMKMVYFDVPNVCNTLRMCLKTKNDYEHKFTVMNYTFTPHFI